MAVTTGHNVRATIMQNIAYNIFLVMSAFLSAAIMSSVIFLTALDILSIN